MLSVHHSYLLCLFTLIYEKQSILSVFILHEKMDTLECSFSNSSYTFVSAGPKKQKKKRTEEHVEPFEIETNAKMQNDEKWPIFFGNNST